MRVKKVLGLFAVVTFFSFIATVSAPSPAAASELPELTVGPHGSYKTVTSAITAARPGQTILLEDGTYHEHVVINKPLVLLGLGKVTLDGDNRDDVIVVEHTHDVRISNFTVCNSGGPGVIPYAGIKIDSSQRVTVDHVPMNNIEHGVYLQESNYCTVEDNAISGKTELLPEDRGDGIGFWRSAHNLAKNNYVWDVRDGTKFEFSPFNQVIGNRFEHLRYGIHYMYSNDNTFSHNVFSDDVAGATPMYSDRITFTDNIFADFPGERAYAILLMNANDCLIKDNLVMESNVGFQFDHSDNNTVEGNAVINCGVAFRVFGTSTGNVFAQNSAQNNVIQVASDYGALPNRYSANGRGNYWSDYTGYDFTGSGIGAEPYDSINYLSQAIYDQPMLELFADSPGLQAVAKGMQLFPLWKFPSIADTHPLMKPPAVKAEWQPWLKTESSPVQNVLFAFLSLMTTMLGLLILGKGRRRRGKLVADI